MFLDLHTIQARENLLIMEENQVCISNLNSETGTFLITVVFVYGHIYWWLLTILSQKN